MKNITSCFDYNYIMSQLKGVAYPRNALGRMLKSGEIVRVKKGIYIRGSGYSRFVLANMIYGPSYISLESALAHYGLIPERIEATTSVSTKRHRIFDTPVGRFEYEVIPVRCFAVGLRYEKFDAQSGYRIAAPEKALADKLAKVKGIDGISHLKDYLFEDLRCEHAQIGRLSLKLLQEVVAVYQKDILNLLVQVVREEKAKL